MKLSYLIFCLFMYSIVASSQNANIATTRSSGGNIFLKTSALNINQRGDHKNIVNTDEVEGSQYFNDSFSKGKVYVNDETTENVYLVRHNAYFDLIEIQGTNEVDELIKAVNISCSINGQLFVYQKYLLKNKGKLGYLKVLHKGNNTALFVQESVKFKEAKPAKTSLTHSFPAKFVQFENFFYLDNSTNIALPITKKSILNIFDDSTYKKRIKSYIKEERINTKNKNDLIKLFKYSDSIINNVN